MKKYIIIFLGISAVIAVAYAVIPSFTKSPKTPVTREEGKLLPRVLFLTSGGFEGNGELAEGVVVALQSFNRRGAYVWLNTREILLKPDKLAEFSIMIVPTSIGYHDGDRKYSLTYMSDVEMKNISDWVKNGGVLIAEENIGRNGIEDIDRVDSSGELNKENWMLSEVFGINMTERDLNGFSMEESGAKIWNGKVRESISENEWALVPAGIHSEKLEVLAHWISADEKIPGIMKNSFGKGEAYLLTSTYLLHPSNDGGYSSIEQIENFYDYVLDGFSNSKELEYEINPWPSGYSTAFCITFDPQGDSSEYDFISGFLKKEKLKATFFIDSSVTGGKLKILEANENISIQSGLYLKRDFSKSEFPVLAREILNEELAFGKTFTGIRFPFRMTNFWGLLFAEENGYIFDSSIGVDHLTDYSGSVFPYNIPASLNSYTKTMKLMEICPVRYDDMHFYKNAAAQGLYADEDQKSDSQLFHKFLSDFYEFAVSKNNGLMVYSGNPGFTGHSLFTIQPLQKLADTLRTRNCWMTTVEDVANFRNSMKEMIIESYETGRTVNMKIRLPDSVTLSEFSVKTKLKPSAIKTPGKYETKQSGGNYYIITSVSNDAEIEFSLDQ